MVRAPANPPPQLLLRKARPASARPATDTSSLVISLSLRQAQRRRDELPESCPPPATPPGQERTWLPARLMPASVQSADGRGARALMAPGGLHDTWLQLALLWAFCRIDYQLATPGVAALARREHIYLDQRFSDHAPLTIDYDFKL